MPDDFSFPEGFIEEAQPPDTNSFEFPEGFREVDAASSPSESGATQMESFLKGAQKGITFGAAPAAQASVEKLIGTVAGFFDPEIKELYEGKPLLDLVDDNKKAFDEAEAANPNSFLAGDLLGSTVVTAPATAVTGLKTAKAAKDLVRAGVLGKKTKTAARALPVATFAAQGAVEGAARGANEGRPLGESAAFGAAFGGAGPLGGKAFRVAKGKISSAAKSLSNFTEDTVLKQIGISPATFRDMKRRGNILGKARGIARSMIQEADAATPSTLRGFHKRTEKLLQDTGKAISRSYKEADKLDPDGFMNPNEIKSTIRNFLLDRDEFPDVKSVDRVVAKIEAKLGTKDPNARLGFEKTWQLVKELDLDSRVWKRATEPDIATSAGQLNLAAKFLRGEMIRGMKVIDDDLAKRLATESALYGQVSKAEDALANRVFQGFSKNKSLPRRGFFEFLTDTTVGSNAARSTSAFLTNNLSRFVQGSANAMGKTAPIIINALEQGGQSAAAAHYTLMNRDPKYRELYNQFLKSEEQERNDAK